LVTGVREVERGDSFNVASGLRGLHGFLAYLVEEKGMGGPLLEGKMNLLVETIEE